MDDPQSRRSDSFFVARGNSQSDMARFCFDPQPDITPLEAARVAGWLLFAGNGEPLDQLRARLAEWGIERHIREGQV